MRWNMQTFMASPPAQHAARLLLKCYAAAATRSSRNPPRSRAGREIPAARWDHTLARAAAVLDAEAGRLHQPAPAHGLLLDVGLELRPGCAGDLEALLLELLPDRRVGVRGLGRVGVTREDAGRRALLHQEPEPDLGGELGVTELGEGRHVRHGALANGPGGRQRMELARAHVRQRRIELREAELRMAAEQPGHLQA